MDSISKNSGFVNREGGTSPMAATSAALPANSAHEKNSRPRWTQRTRPVGRQAHHLPDDEIMNALIDSYRNGSTSARRRLNSAIKERLIQIRQQAGKIGTNYCQFDGNKKAADVGLNHKGQVTMWLYEVAS